MAIPVDRKLPLHPNYSDLFSVPDGVHADEVWTATPNDYGLIKLIGLWLNPVELQHMIRLVIRGSDGLYHGVSGVWAFFGFPGGGPDQSKLKPKVEYWPESPIDVYKGNAQVTNGAGEAFHTPKEGGETLMIQFLHYDRTGKSYRGYPSDIVYGAKVLPTHLNQHTGIVAVFEWRPNEGSMVG